VQIPNQDTRLAAVRRSRARRRGDSDQVPDAAPDLGASVTDETPLVSDAQSAKDQPAKSAVDSLSQAATGNGGGTTANTSKGHDFRNPAGGSADGRAQHQHGRRLNSGPNADTQLEPGRPRALRATREQAFQDLSDQGGTVRCGSARRNWVAATWKSIFPTER